MLQDSSFVGSTGGKIAQLQESSPKGEDPEQQAALQDELKSKEQALEAERQQKEHLANLISEMEKKLVTGGKALEDRERDQLQKQREMQL